MQKKEKSRKDEDARKASTSSSGRKHEIVSKDLKKVSGGGIKSDAKKRGGSQESFEEVEEV